jgi:hypothetical protein
MTNNYAVARFVSEAHALERARMKDVWDKLGYHYTLIGLALKDPGPPPKYHLS